MGRLFERERLYKLNNPAPPGSLEHYKENFAYNAGEALNTAKDVLSGAEQGYQPPADVSWGRLSLKEKAKATGQEFLNKTVGDVSRGIRTLRDETQQVLDKAPTGDYTPTASVGKNFLSELNKRANAISADVISGVTGGQLTAPRPDFQNESGFVKTFDENVMPVIGQTIGMIGALSSIEGGITKMASASPSLVILGTKYPILAKYVAPFVKSATAFSAYGQLDPQLGNDYMARLKKAGIDTATAIPYTALGFVKNFKASVPLATLLGFGMAKLSGADNKDALVAGLALGFLDLYGKRGGEGDTYLLKGKQISTVHDVQSALKGESLDIFNKYSDVKITDGTAPEKVTSLYRKMAHQYSTDLNPNVDPKIMAEINGAYDVLSGRNQSVSNVEPETPKTEVKKETVPKTETAVAEKTPATPQESFKNFIQAIPEEHRGIVVDMVSKPFTPEMVAGLTKEEKAVLGAGLQYAKQLPNADLKTIKSNLDALQKTTPVLIPKVPEPEMPVYYRGGGQGEVLKGKTAQDILDYEVKELGNKDVKAEPGVDLSKVKSENTQWLTVDKTSAKEYGKVEEIKGNFKILARDSDGGVLVEKLDRTTKPPKTPIKITGTPKETLKLKYPEPKEKITPTKLRDLGIVFSKQDVLGILRNSSEFKDGSLLTMKEGLLRFEGKTNKFGIKPEALGLHDIKEGTEIKVNKEELTKTKGKIPEISFKTDSPRLKELQRRYKELSKAWDNAPTKKSRKSISKAMGKIQRQFASLKKDIDVGKEARLRIKQTTYEQFEKRVLELQKQHGVSFPVRMVHEMIDSKTGDNVLAMAWDNSITAVEKVTQYSADHEFMHIVEDSLLGKGSFKGITREGLDKVTSEEYGIDINDKTSLKEKRASLFEEYVDKKGQMKLGGRLKEWFKHILNSFKQLFNFSKKVSLNDFYDRIFYGKSKINEVLKSEGLSEKVTEYSSDNGKIKAKMDLSEKSISDKLSFKTDEKPLVTEKGSIKVREVFKNVYQKIYGEENMPKITELFKRLGDKELTFDMTRKGFSEGKRIQKIADSRKMQAKLWLQKKEFKRKSDLIVKKFLNKEYQRGQLRQVLEQLTEGFPKKVRDNLLSQKRVFNIKSGKHLADILNSIERVGEQVARNRELGQLKKEIISMIKAKDLRKTENLRRLLGFKQIKNMSRDDLEEFKKYIDEAKIKDTFLSVRQLETFNNTELAGIRTIREAKEKLAERTGKTIEELSNIKVAEHDLFTYDSALAQKNPLYNAMVEDTYRAQLEAEMVIHKAEEKVNELMSEARSSRSRGLMDRIIPTDKVIFEYMGSENKPELVSKMTPEELNAAEYMMGEYSDMRDYLVEKKTLNKYKNNYVTHVRRGFMEAFKEDGFVKAIKEIGEKSKEELANFKIISDTGEILALEKFFKYSLRRTGKVKPTNNVARAFLAYKKAFETKRALDSIIPKFDIYVSALSPEMKTKRGLLMDRSLKEFFNLWMNNKKGRKFSFGGMVPVGGKTDVTVRGLRAFTTMVDLGLSIPVGFGSMFGEQAVNFINLGTKKMMLGTARMRTKQGQKIVNDNRAFVGKSMKESFGDASDDALDKTTKALYGFFRMGNLLATKQFLLGSLTPEEYSSGKISPERLAKIKLDMGRWRVVEGANSVVGNTSIGKAVMQYKTWAVPPLTAVASNVKYIFKNIKKDGTFKSKQARELFRMTAMTALILFLTIGNDSKDKSFIGKIKNKIISESLTVMQAMNPTLFFGSPRTLAFLYQLGLSLQQLITLQKYTSSGAGYKAGDLKAPKTFMRAVTPRAVKQFSN